MFCHGATLTHSYSGEIIVPFMYLTVSSLSSRGEKSVKLNDDNFCYLIFILAYPL